VTTTPGPAAVLSNLHVALTSLGDALAEPALDPIIKAEADLALAVEQLRRLPANPPPPDARATVRVEIARVRAALERCRRLGASLEFVAHASLAAQGRGGAYDRLGSEARSAPRGALLARG
jgi:type VI protein secretion system component VasF